MVDFIATLLSMSLSASALIILLLLLKPLYKHRLSMKWQYYIWLVVLVRLVLPFSFEVDLAGRLFNEAAQVSSAQPGGGQAGGTPQSGILPVSVAESDIWGMVIRNLWLVWILPAIALFVRKITIYQSFVRYIKAGRAEVGDIRELERFGKIAERENIKTAVGLYTNNLITSPLLIGFFRPHIVLPSLDKREISDTDYNNIMLHELTHLKRGDMFYKWLTQFVICLHWFNPLVHLMGREINNACEFSCDEAVAVNMNSDEITAYGDTLLSSLGSGNYSDAVLSVTLNDNKKILQNRLMFLKNAAKPRKTRRVVEIALCMVIFAAASVTWVQAGIFSQPETEAPSRFTDPTLPTPIVEHFVDEDYNGWMFLRWDVIPEAHDHVVYLNGVYTFISMGMGGDGWAGFAVEFLINHPTRPLPVVPGANYIQIRAVGEGGNVYSALSEPVVFIYE